MSSIYWRGGIAWLKWKDELGFTHRESLRTRNKTQAKNAKIEKDAQILRRRLKLEKAPPKPILFGELLDSFLENVSSHLASNDQDASRAKHLEELRSKMASDVIPADLLAVMNRIPNPQSKHHIRALVRRVYNYGTNVLKRYCGDGNPACAKELVVKIPKRKARYLPSAWVLPIIQAAPDEDRGIFATDAMTGMRKNEICGLLVEDVDLDARLIHVRHSYDKEWPKDKEERVVPIPEALVPYLKVELGRVRSKWLFPNSKGEMRSKDWRAANVMRRALKAAGFVIGYDHTCRRKTCSFEKERRADNAPSRCPRCGFKLWVEGVPAKFTFKDLRSTFLTHVLTVSNAVVAQRLAGHSDQELLEKHYIGHDTEGMRAAVNSLPYAQPGHNLGTVANAPESFSAEVVRISQRKPND